MKWKIASLTAAGIAEQLGGRNDPVRRRRGDDQRSGLSQRLLNLLLLLRLRELRLRIEEHQLPPPPLFHLRLDLLAG